MDSFDPVKFRNVFAIEREIAKITPTDQGKTSEMADANAPTNTHAANLKNALAMLDETMVTVDDLQKKLDSVNSRIETLTGQAAKSPSANVSKNLRSLNARREVQLRALDRARRAYASARKTYLQVSGKLATHQKAYDDALSVAQVELADAHRCKAALARSLNALLPHKPTETQFLEQHTGSFGYIPVDTTLFFETLIALDRQLTLDPDYAETTRRYRPVRFLDVGCGTGRNLALLKTSRLLEIQSLAGFDIDETRLCEGRDMFDLGDEIGPGDALTYDYAPFDVIFSFRPFRDPDMLENYENRMVATMSDTAYLVAVLHDDLARFPELRCVSSSLGIWKKSV